MTEQDWLDCTDTEKMLRFLKRRPTNRLAKKRKLRLFSVACCRRIWPLIAHERSRSAVLVAERFADAQATSEELQTAESEARAIWLKHANDDAVMACYHVCTKNDAGFHTSNTAVRAVWRHQREGRSQGDDPLMAFRPSIHPVEEAEQCRLIRDIFGNPFRPLPTKGKRAWEDQKRGWLTWQGGTIPNMAQAIYEERQIPSGYLDSSRLAILADALQDAGCDNQDILEHLRGPGPHVRGCWPVDLLLCQ